MDSLPPREEQAYLDGLDCIQARWPIQREQQYYASLRDMREVKAFERGIEYALSEQRAEWL